MREDAHCDQRLSWTGPSASSLLLGILHSHTPGPLSPPLQAPLLNSLLQSTSPASVQECRAGHGQESASGHWQPRALGSLVVRG